MRSVGASEARNNLSHLLELVQRGQEFTITRRGNTITRRGKEVARLVPARPIRSREVARAAVRRIRERR